MEVEERALRAFCSCAYMYAAATEDILFCGVAVAEMCEVDVIGCCGD